MKLKDASFLIRIYSFLMSNNKVQSNIQVCYVDALPVSIVERS
jgi:hypothetical protein